MISSLSASVSGIQASTLRADVGAHDVANINTPGFSQTRPVQSALTNGTQVAALQKIAPASPEYSATELAEEAVEQMENLATLKANSQTLRTQDEMLGHVVDWFA